MSLHTYQKSEDKRVTTPNAAEDPEKLDHSDIAGGM